jgi:hypothetical protein
MRRKLVLTLALAVFGALMVAGNAGAGSGLLDTSSSGVGVNLPGGDDLDTLGALPQCANLRDDDGDGHTDLADAGCSGPLDNNESDDPSGGDTSTGDTGSGGDTTLPPTTTTPPPVGGGSGGDTGGGVGPGGDGGRGGGQAGGGGGGGENGSGGSRSGHRGDDGEQLPDNPPRNPDGTPTDTNPTLTVADFGPAPIGVPNFVIDQFTIPPFLLPIYQACGTQYGIPWEVLAGINRIETAFGTNLNVSTAGAVGWMQFMPSTWKAYGVDANNDGRKDPYNPVDAICAAARYLKAAGGDQDLRQGIFAYNHADWYVDEVLLYAKQYGNLPDDLVGSLTGLTEGDRFPIAAKARYADDISEREAAKRAKPSRGSAGNLADVVSGSPTRRGINIYSKEGAPIVAVNDGVVKEIGHTDKLGNYMVLQDSYGNRFTYAQVGKISKVYAVPKQHRLSANDFKIVTPKRDAAPDEPATAGTNGSDKHAPASAKPSSKSEEAKTSRTPANTEDVRRRLYAFPERRHNVDRADLSGQLDDVLKHRMPAYESVKSYLGGVLNLDQSDLELKPLREGSHVVAGTVLGHVGKTDELAPHLNFSIRPAGKGAPKVDPKPILDGWKLLEATAIYRAAGQNPFADSSASIGQVLLMSKEQAEHRVLADPRLSIYECGREDIRTGQIDVRVLRLLEYLAGRGYRLTITSLKCGHSITTTSGNISEHSTGDAVDIAQINGQPVLGNQGPGTLAYALVEDVLQLQGTMEPHQVISLMDLGGPSFAMADHDDHVHVGYQPATGPESSASKQFDQILKPDQWKRLIGRIADIDNPKVPTSPSKFAIPSKHGNKDDESKAPRRASGAHIGE